MPVFKFLTTQHHLLTFTNQKSLHPSPELQLKMSAVLGTEKGVFMNIVTVVEIKRSGFAVLDACVSSVARFLYLILRQACRYGTSFSPIGSGWPWSASCCAKIWTITWPQRQRLKVMPLR
jgi:hypothetical protein